MTHGDVKPSTGGTLTFMAPEQMNGSSPTTKFDVYRLEVVLIVNDLICHKETLYVLISHRS